MIRKHVLITCCPRFVVNCPACREDMVALLEQQKTKLQEQISDWKHSHAPTLKRIEVKSTSYALQISCAK